MLLPWRLVFLIFAASLGSAGAAFAVAGLAYVPAAIVGVILGFFGCVFGSLRKVAVASICVMVATALSRYSADWVTLWLIIPVLALLTGTELARYGTRVGVFAIMSCILLVGPAAPNTELGLLLVVYAATTLTGAAIAEAVHVAGRAPRTDAEVGFVVAHSIAFATGLILAQLIAIYFDTAQSHWIAMLFAARALDPPEQRLVQVRRRAVSMVGGAAVAGALVFLPVAAVFLSILGVMSVLVGLRYLPSGGLHAPFFMSAGVVLATSPTAGTALFRAEAVVVASLLVVLVFWLGASIRRAIALRAKD